MPDHARPPADLFRRALHDRPFVLLTLGFCGWLLVSMLVSDGTESWQRAAASLGVAAFLGAVAIGRAVWLLRRMTREAHDAA